MVFGEPRGFFGGGEEEFIGGSGWHADLGWHPGEGVEDALSTGVCQPDPVASVMARSWAGVPAIDSMRRPVFFDGGQGLIVDEYSGSWRREWSAVKVEGSVDLLGRRLRGVG
jgi:hypothetical protein